MKNKIKKRVMAGSMAVVMTAAGVGAYGYEKEAMSEVKAEEEDMNTLKKVTEEALRDSDTGSDGETYKDESVYVKADPSGKVTETTVTEWLKNPEKGTVEDATSLENIKNIKGDETFTTGNGDVISWDSEGNDIYYQGTTNQELPVDVSISYKLNGREVSAEELTGKNGKLEMTINYQNQSKEMVDVDGEEVEMYTPFTVATAMMLPTDAYQNVTIDNGKIVSDADKDIIVGIAFPGMEENLGIENLDLDIPDSITITADIKDATVEPTITMVSSNLFNEFNFDKIDGFDDLESSIEELKDATNQLVDGSRELSDGSKELAEGAKTLKDGADSLDSGAKTLRDGASALADGNQSLAAGVHTLNDKSGELLSGVSELASGVTAYTQGVSGLKDGALALSSGTTSLKDGIASAYEAAGKILAGYTGDGTTKNPGANQLIAKTSEMITGTTQALTGAAQSLDKAKSSLDAATVSSQNVNVSIQGQEAAARAVVAALKSAGMDADTADSYYEVILGAINQNISGTADDVDNTQAIAGVKAALDSASGYLNTASQAAGGASQYAAGLNQTLEQVYGGTQNLYYALGNNGSEESPMIGKAILQLEAGAKQLADGTTKLNQSSGVLNAGVSALQDGGTQLVSGVKQLSEGSDAASAGASQLETGASQLSAGTGTLAEGAGTLSEGTDTLEAGSETLAEGMAEYKSKAIDRLTALFDGNIDRVILRIDAMKDLGKNYKTFAGAKDDMNGSTKFVIETEGID